MKKNDQEVLICGKTKEYIRKMFFSKKLPDMINEIQRSTELAPLDVNTLQSFLESLKIEEEEIIGCISSQFPDLMKDSAIKPPSVSDLMDGASDMEWRSKADSCIFYINDALERLRPRIANKEKIEDSYWLDTSIIFLTYQDILEKDRIYKTQLYYAKITTIIDDFGCSRLEAENRAKLSKEYSDYKYLTLLLERMDKFDMLAKKKDHQY